LMETGRGCAGWDVVCLDAVNARLGCAVHAARKFGTSRRERL
jgi:hypothetical protein